MAWKSPAETLQEWKEQRARERRSYDPLISRGGQAPGATPLIRGRPDSPFPPTGLPGQQSTQSIADIFSGGGAAPPAPLIAGPSISDRVRGNRYANMDPRERQALNLTIAGELAPSSYNTPEGDQEVANMVSTVRNRSAQTGKSIEDTVKQNQQYSPWNTLPDRAAMRERFREHAPDVRRMVANAVTGDVMPTHQQLSSYHADYANPKWARREPEPEAQAGRHIFYSNVRPWHSRGPDLPAAPVGEITTQDLAPLPQPLNAPVGPVTAGTDLPPPADYVAPPPYTGGPVNAPLVTPPALSGGFTPESGMPASPAERIGAGLAAPQIGDPGLQPALGPRPPLIALAEDRATRERPRAFDPRLAEQEALDYSRELNRGRALSNLPQNGPRAPLIAPPAGVPQSPPPAPAPALAQPPRAIDLGRGQFGPSIEEGPIPTNIPREAPVEPAPAPVPLPPAPAAPVSTMRDVAGAARGTGVDYIYRDPSTNILSGFDDKNPWTPEQQAQIAGAVPGIVTDAGGLRLTPAAPARPPLVAPAAAVPSGAPLVTPRRTVTPQTPVSPEPESNLPPLPSTTVPNVPSVTPAPVQPLIAPTNPMDQFAGRTPALDISVGPKGHERGERKFAQGEKLAGRIGMGIGGVGGLVGGGIPGLVAGAGLGRTAGRATARGLDPNRSIFERGPLGFFGNIFGFGRGRDKDKDKDKDKRPEGLSKKDTGISSPPSSAYGGYGNRYQGGTYSGQSTGGRYLTEGTGGAYR